LNEFVICINNESNPASLIVGKVYRKLPDPEAESHNMLRVVDEDKSEPGGYPIQPQCSHLSSRPRWPSRH